MSSGLRRRAVLAAAGAALLMLAPGCGDALPPKITPGQRADLHALVGQARTAAGAGDLAATQAALGRLKAQVRTLRDRGALDRTSAAELLKISAVTDLKATLALRPAVAEADDEGTEAPAAAPPPIAPAPPAATPPGQRAPKGRGHAKKREKDDRAR